jgi:cytidylate kinase
VIIAIDGPAGSGKSSTARAVAGRLGFLHLDSGALYRGFALVAARRGWTREDGSVPESMIEGLARQAVDARVVGRGLQVMVDGAAVPDGELRTADVTAAASKVSAHRPIRLRVNEILRRLASDHSGHIVCEGRDMGTVVFPDASLKVWMEAGAEERARRRLRQLGRATTPRSLREQKDRLEARDTADSRRSESPLRRAADAVVIDTTDLSFEEQVQRIVDEARHRLDMP